MNIENNYPTLKIVLFEIANRYGFPVAFVYDFIRWGAVRDFKDKNGNKIKNFQGAFVSFCRNKERSMKDEYKLEKECFK